MRTVKEMSELTGISVRTLHYYDEIGLLSPTRKSEAGYRLYDDKALEDLQQILFFREFDIPLKEIRSIMENPALDRNHILQMQKKMLAAKKERLERLIVSIDDILKGDNKMDFEVFNKSEIAEMFEAMAANMPDALRSAALEEFGSMAQWKAHYMEVFSREDMQKGYRKILEWFGGKDEYLDAVKTPVSRELAESYNKRLELVLEKLYSRKALGINSFDVREAVAEYGFVLKQLSQVKEETGLMLAQAKYFRNEHTRRITDEKYGGGAAEFFAQAIEAFYGGRVS